MDFHSKHLLLPAQIDISVVEHSLTDNSPADCVAHSCFRLTLQVFSQCFFSRHPKEQSTLTDQTLKLPPALIVSAVTAATAEGVTPIPKEKLPSVHPPLSRLRVHNDLQTRIKDFPMIRMEGFPPD